jgi:kinesin family protein C1
VSHDEKAGTTAVAHAEAADCGGPEACTALLARAIAARAVGATAANERSSRSHLAFLLSVRGTNAATGQTRLGAPANLVPFAFSRQRCMSPRPACCSKHCQGSKLSHRAHAG